VPALQQVKSDLQSAQDEAFRNMASRIQESCREDANELRKQIHQQEEGLTKLTSLCSSMKQELSDIWKELERLERVKMDRDECLEELNRHRSHMESALTELRRNVDEVKRSAMRHETPIIKTPEPPKEPPRAATPEPTPEFKQAPKETYVILKGAADNSVHYLCNLENTLGRSNACSTMIATSQSISNQHASITVSARGAVLRDLGSRNGTRLNDRRVGVNEGLSVESGDAVQLGVDGPSFVFEWGPAASKMLPREYQAVLVNMASRYEGNAHQYDNRLLN